MAERIRALTGTAGITERQRVMRLAGRSATLCAKCARPLATDEAVWRRRIRFGRGMFGAVVTVVAPVCQGCSEVGLRVHYRPAAPCEGCTRPVHQVYGRRWHARTFCCEHCEKAVRLEEARHKRVAARQTKECDACGETFEPARKDACFCSGACRQRAYRQRGVTAFKSEPVGRIRDP